MTDPRPLLTPRFWYAAGERAAKTFAQTALATLTVSSVPLDVLHVNWPGVLSVSLGATVLSVLTSLASLTSLGGNAVPNVPAAQDTVR